MAGPRHALRLRQLARRALRRVARLGPVLIDRLAGCYGLRSGWRRMALVFGGLLAIGAIGVPVISGLAILAGMVGVIVTHFVWWLNERQREDYLRQTLDEEIDILRLPEYQAVAMWLSAYLLLVFPLGLRELRGLFGTETRSISTWFIYSLEQVVRSVVDVFDMVGLENQTSIVARRPASRIVQAGERVLVTLLIFNAITRWLGIRRTIRDAKRALRSDPSFTVHLGRRSLGFLREVFRSGDEAIEVRRNAAIALSKLAEKASWRREILRAVEGTLTDGVAADADAGVRRMGIETLGAGGGKPSRAVVAALRQAIVDEDRSVRFAALVACGRRRVVGLADLVLPAGREFLASTHDEEAMGLLDSIESLTLGAGIPDLEDLIQGDRSFAVRRRAFGVLESLASERAGSLLESSLWQDPDPEFRVRALHRIARNERNPNRLAMLEAYARKDPDPGVRSRALRVLRETFPAEGRVGRTARDCLCDGDVFVREEAVECLRAMADGEGMAILQGALAAEAEPRVLARIASGLVDRYRELLESLGSADRVRLLHQLARLNLHRHGADVETAVARVYVAEIAREGASEAMAREFLDLIGELRDEEAEALLVRFARRGSERVGQRATRLLQDRQRRAIPLGAEAQAIVRAAETGETNKNVAR